MDKRLLQTFVVTLLFLTVYSFLMPRQQPKPQPLVSQQVATVTAVTTTSSPKTEPLEDEKKLPTATIGYFIVTYSPRGGYIKKISLKTFQEELLYKNIGLVPAEKDKEFTVTSQNDRIIFTSDTNETKEFIFQDSLLKIRVSPALSEMVLFSNQLSTSALDHGYQEIFYFENNEVKRKNLKDIKDKTEIKSEETKFAGARDRYFCASLLEGSYAIKWNKDKNDIYLTLMAPLPETSLYIGPQIESKLKTLGLQNIINYGFFHGIGSGLAWLLNLFYAVTKSWGVSIILFSIFVYALLFPFTMKSTKAMKKMAELQPEIDELRKKYKDNPQKLNKETIALYKKYKINPLGGCLPLLFQFPVFIALYQVLLRFVELKGASFLWIKDLSLPDHAFKLPFPAPVDYFNVLPIIIAIIGLIQQKTATVASVSKEQKSMGLIFSLLMAVIFYSFPASLSLYWLVQNALTLAYQLRITKTKHLSPAQ